MGMLVMVFVCINWQPLLLSCALGLVKNNNTWYHFRK